MMKQIQRLCVMIMVSGALFVLPHNVHATVTVSYDGCFAISSGARTATVHMLDMLCTIEVSNDSTATTWSATVANLDPHYYIVRQDGQVLSDVVYNTSTMQFSIDVGQNDSTTLRIRPWENLDNQDEVTILAGSDPQNQEPDEVPNPIFVDFMEYASTMNELLLVIAGDVIRGSTTDADTQELEYQATIDLMEETPITTVTTVGDHDARQEYTEYFERYFGEIPRVVSYNANLHFFLINSVESPEHEGEISDSTMTWLDTALEQSDAEYKVVVLHHPFDVPDGAFSSGVAEEDRLALAQVLVNHNVQVAFVGDAHWYDVDTIDSDTPGFEGLTGSFLQLVMGGLGGRIDQYIQVHPNTADHFMMMITFGDPNDADGVSYTRLTQDDLDIQKEEHSQNDGTETAIDVTIENNGTVAIPHMRVKFFGSAPQNNTYYGFTSDGEVLEAITQQFGTQKRGYVELFDVPASSSVDVRMATVQTPYQGVMNNYKTDGTMTFSQLPESTDQATELLVTAADQAGTIEIDDWSPDQNLRRWTEQAGSASAQTRYVLTGLDAYRTYAITMNGNMIRRKLADQNGEIHFRYSGKRTRRFSVISEPGLWPATTAVLPADSRISDVRIYGRNARLQNTFIAFATDLTHGFESTWADIDDDGELELVIIPSEGRVGHMLVYEKNGTRRASKYPFGRNFTEGLDIARADLGGTGKDWIVTSSHRNDGRIHLYRYNTNSHRLVKIKKIHPFGESFRGGIHVTAADLNGDGDDELIVAQKSGHGVIRAYNWRRRTQKMKLLDSIEVHTGNGGINLASGDLDFDGREEIVAGTQSGNGMVYLLQYSPTRKQFSIGDTIRAFPKGFDGGVTVSVAQLNSTKREEIVVAPRGGNQSHAAVRVYTLKRNSGLEKIASTRPFGRAYQDGFTVAFFQNNSDQKLEMSVTGKNSVGNVRVYRLRGTRMQKIYGYKPYGSTFTAGINLSK